MQLSHSPPPGRPPGSRAFRYLRADSGIVGSQPTSVMDYEMGRVMCLNTKAPAASPSRTCLGGHTRGRDQGSYPT